MKRTSAVLVSILLVTTMAPAGLADTDEAEGEVVERIEAENGRPLTETRTVPGSPGLHVTETWVYPGQAPVEELDDGDGFRYPVLQDPTTDCSSNAHNTWGFRWLEPYHAFANDHVDLLADAGLAWNLETTGTPFGQISPGEHGEPRTLDGVNQILFDGFGSTDWLARAVIWWLPLEAAGQEVPVAVESDQLYNTDRPITTDPASGGYDIHGIAVHEMGHTFGLQHAGDACLTMYPYISWGTTDQRTLGDGDILGIRGLYGPMPVPG